MEARKKDYSFLLLENHKKKLTIDASAYFYRI